MKPKHIVILQLASWPLRIQANPRPNKIYSTSDQLHADLGNLSKKINSMQPELDRLIAGLAMSPELEEESKDDFSLFFENLISDQKVIFGDEEIISTEASELIEIDIEVVEDSEKESTQKEATTQAMIVTTESVINTTKPPESPTTKLVPPELPEIPSVEPVIEIADPDSPSLSLSDVDLEEFYKTYEEGQTIEVELRNEDEDKVEELELIDLG